MSNHLRIVSHACASPTLTLLVTIETLLSFGTSLSNQLRIVFHAFAKPTFTLLVTMATLLSLGTSLSNHLRIVSHAFASPTLTLFVMIVFLLSSSTSLLNHSRIVDHPFAMPPLITFITGIVFSTPLNQDDKVSQAFLMPPFTASTTGIVFSSLLNHVVKDSQAFLMPPFTASTTGMVLSSPLNHFVKVSQAFLIPPLTASTVGMVPSSPLNQLVKVSHPFLMAPLIASTVGIIPPVSVLNHPVRVSHPALTRLTPISKTFPAVCKAESQPALNLSITFVCIHVPMLPNQSIMPCATPSIILVPNPLVVESDDAPVPLIPNADLNPLIKGVTIFVPIHPTIPLKNSMIPLNIPVMIAFPQANNPASLSYPAASIFSLKKFAMSVATLARTDPSPLTISIPAARAAPIISPVDFKVDCIDAWLFVKILFMPLTISPGTDVHSIPFIAPVIASLIAVPISSSKLTAPDQSNVLIAVKTALETLLPTSSHFVSCKAFVIIDMTPFANVTSVTPAFSKSKSFTNLFNPVAIAVP